MTVSLSILHETRQTIYDFESESRGRFDFRSYQELVMSVLQVMTLFLYFRDFVQIYGVHRLEMV